MPQGGIEQGQANGTASLLIKLGLIKRRNIMTTILSALVLMGSLLNNDVLTTVFNFHQTNWAVAFGYCSQT